MDVFDGAVVLIELVPALESALVWYGALHLHVHRCLPHLVDKLITIAAFLVAPACESQVDLVDFIQDHSLELFLIFEVLFGSSFDMVQHIIASVQIVVLSSDFHAFWASALELSFILRIESFSLSTRIVLSRSSRFCLVRNLLVWIFWCLLAGRITVLTGRDRALGLWRLMSGSIVEITLILLPLTHNVGKSDLFPLSLVQNVLEIFLGMSNHRVVSNEDPCAFLISK